MGFLPNISFCQFFDLLSEYEQTIFFSQKPDSTIKLYFLRILAFALFRVCLNKNLAIWSSWTQFLVNMSSALMPKQLALLQPGNGARIILLW